MTQNISPGIFILTARDLEAREHQSFLRGVARGRFEERIERGHEPVAINCANWKDGRCETCGVQWQDMQVGAEYRCPKFIRRSAALTVKERTDG